jgi:glycosyltransferase involved in cell wall biosynthesis
VPDLRVALIVPGFSSDESDWCIPALLDYVRALSRRIDLEVFTLRYPHRRDSYRIGNATVHSLGWAQRRGLYSPWLWATAYRAIMRRQHQAPFSVLHAFWADEPAWIGAACARRLGIPLVVSVAGGELSAMPRVHYGLRRHVLQRRWIGRALRTAKVVTAGSCYLIALAKAQGFSAIRHAPLGVDTQLFSPAAQPHQMSLITVGSLLPVKGHAALVKVMRRVVDVIPGAHLTIVGDGPERSGLQQLIESLQLRENVSLQPAIAHELLPAYYSASDLYVQSSWHEAQGMVVLEAAACGVPLVGTAVGTLAELAPDAALAVPAGDEQALGSAVIEILQDDVRRRMLAAAALARVVTVYGIERCVERFLELYQYAVEVD